MHYHLSALNDETSYKLLVFSKEKHVEFWESIKWGQSGIPRITSTGDFDVFHGKNQIHVWIFKIYFHILKAPRCAIVPSTYFVFEERTFRLLLGGITIWEMLNIIIYYLQLGARYLVIILVNSLDKLYLIT